MKKSKTKHLTVDTIIQDTLNHASDEDVTRIIQNLGRLLRSPKYQNLDPGRKDK